MSTFTFSSVFAVSTLKFGAPYNNNYTEEEEANKIEKYDKLDEKT